MIHLAYCADKLMAPGLHAAVASSLCNASEPVTLWLYLDGFNPSDIRRVHETAVRANPDVRIRMLEIDLSRFKGYRGLWSNHLTYARLALADIMDVDRVLYLDADTICNTDPAELFHIDLDGRIVAMATEQTVGDSPDRKLLMEHSIPADAPYYNGGVTVIDIARWREEGISEKVKTFCDAHPHHLFTADQTCLNAVLRGSVVTLERRWNRPVFPGRKHEGAWDASEPCIHHFVGNPKPWDPGGFWLCRGWPLFRRYARNDEWMRHQFRSGTWKRVWRMKAAYQWALRST